LFKLASNIRAQAASLAAVLQHHVGPGAPAMADATRLLQSGKKIVITGMGASLFASLPLQYHLCAHGLNATAIEAGELLHYLSEACNDAVVLMVSRSGESVEIARLLERINRRVPVIGVTNEPASLLARSSDVTLSIASLPDEIVAIQTYTGTLLTLHLLANSVTNSLSAAVAEMTKLLPTFDSLVATSMNSLSGWNQFLRPASPVYLLGRGFSLSSTLEGALLFHEIAKSPAVAMPIASFRHGPVEVVDENFRGFVFVPADPTHDLNPALARDLVAFGGQIRLVGREDANARFAPWCDLPAVSAVLAPLFEIVPIQAAAYQMAVLRGVEPGSFRFAPQVAVDEASFNREGGSH
jgi:glucosamine--fructose-6-phosphate aminotransferase (isomerizing)